nr:MAG TPA: Surface-adhesin protein [Caudoviricetes sp.]
MGVGRTLWRACSVWREGTRARSAKFMLQIVCDVLYKFFKVNPH